VKKKLLRRSRDAESNHRSTGSANPRPAAAPSLSVRRRWAFGLAAAVLAPILFLLALEAALRVASFGNSASFFLPLRLGDKDYLVENQKFGWRFFGPEMARTPYPLLLPKAKAPWTFRVFVFGESAAYGDPQPEFGLSRMLEALLSLRYPDRRIEVVNTAMTGINSHVVWPIAEDCAGLQGDAWVVYMGNNEVVGPFGSGTVFGPKAPPRALVRLSLAFKATRVGQLLDSVVRRLHPRPAREAVWGGMSMFVKNHVRAEDPRMAAVYANFQGNLADIIELGARHGARVIVSSMARNLRDCAPFASERDPGLAPNGAARWQQLFDSGVQAQNAGRPLDAITSFDAAAKLDASSADLHYRWGQCCLATTNPAEALRQFTLACDEDALRFRSDTRLNQIIRQTAAAQQQAGVTFVDSQETLAADSPDHIVGNDFLYEHVHLNFDGNYRIALAMARQIAPTNAVWASKAECARRLAFTDYSRSEGERAILQRLNDPPYTSQLNHEESYQAAKARYERTLPATKPEAVAREKELCRQAVASWPDDWILRENLAVFQEQTHDFAGAAESFRRITELLPQSYEAWRSLGIALANLRKFPEAEAALTQALRLQPDDVPSMEGLAELDAAQGKKPEARRRYEAILKLKPYFGPAHLGLAKLLDASGSHAAAEAEFGKSMEARVNTPAAFAALGREFFVKGDYRSALTNFLDSVRLNPSDPEVHVNLGLTLAQLGDWDGAQANYMEAIRLDPSFAEGHFCLGLVFGRRGDDAAASEQFGLAVKLKPDLVEARLNWGIALFNQHRDAEARAQFEEALQRAPDNSMAAAYLRRLERRASLEPHS
jgi:tetratricopeptide (TPR) repeat protein